MFFWRNTSASHHHFQSSSPIRTRSAHSMWVIMACALAFAAVLGTPTQEAQANGGPQGKDFGLGIIAGDPTGLTAKLWLDASNALDFHLSFDFTDEDITFLVDYLLHFGAFNVRSNSIELPLYIGIGGKLSIDSFEDRRDDRDARIGLGARVPFGLALLLKRAPLEFFLEVAVGVRIFPATNTFLDAGLGARYYF